jgi:glycosyltransferase involved in cell wall biosynthesis
MTRRGLTIVGGSVVGLKDDGVWVAQSRFLTYLRQMETLAGSVDLFATQIDVADLGGYEEMPDSITVYPLRWTLRPTPPGKAAASFVDLFRIGRSLGTSRYSIDWFPDGGGIAAAWLFHVMGTNHLTYFKSDVSSLRRETGPLRRLTASYWRLYEKAEFRWSKAVVFRDQAQLRRNRHLVGGVVEAAAPMLSVYSSAPLVRTSVPNDDGELRILFVGKTVPEKGLGDLVAAVGLILARNPDLEFSVKVLGGNVAAPTDPTDGHSVPKWLAPLLDQQPGVRSRFEFLGYVDDQDDLAECYEAADIFVLPSWFEGFPRVIDEAMSFGLPVVATAVGGIPDVLESGHDSFVVSAHQPGELATCLSELIDSADLRAQMGAAGRRSFEIRYRESAAQQHARMLGIVA